MNTEQALRQEILTKFGNKCRACGFSHPAALQIDHVNGGGTKELNEISRLQFYRRVLADNLGLYQLLCANCNVIKSVLCWERNRPPQVIPKYRISDTDVELFESLPPEFTTGQIKQTLAKHSEVINRLLKSWVKLGLTTKIGYGQWRKAAVLDGANFEAPKTH